MSNKQAETEKPLMSRCNLKILKSYEKIIIRRAS